MAWSNAKPNGYGGYKQERNDRGQKESLHGPTVKGKRITGDHVHFHKDGATTTKGDRKYTVSHRYCSNCRKEKSQRTNYMSLWYCSKCESHMRSYPKWMVISLIKEANLRIWLFFINQTNLNQLVLSLQIRFEVKDHLPICHSLQSFS